MKINNVYVGGWFQRTMLQLSEIYDFLRDGKTQLDLDPEKLQEYRKELGIGKIEYGVAGEEYVEYTTNMDITVKIFEDGLITLNNTNVSEDTLFADIDHVADYYENKLSPAFSYLFNKITKNDMATLLSRTEKQKYFEFNNPNYDVVRGDKYYFINVKKKSEANIERYIEEQIFIREFKGQLHRYLNMHRIIWEKIDAVKENANVKGSDIVKFTTKLEGYAKTINLIDGRINQMSTYISTREKIAKSDKDLAEFLAISGYRYETLRDTLDYIKYLWTMTKNYVTSAQKLFDNLKQDVTSKSVDSLTIVTSMSAGAGIIGLLTETAPEFTIFGVLYFFILALLGWSSTKILGLISNSRKYEVSDVEYDKNIK